MAETIDKGDMITAETKSKVCLYLSDNLMRRVRSVAERDGLKLGRLFARGVQRELDVYELLHRLDATNQLKEGAQRCS